MFEILKSVVFVVIMVPIFMALVLGLIYGMGTLCNLISKREH